MILAVMRIPPDLNGHGGSQRAWRLVEALTRIGPVHFVLVYRKSDKDAETVCLKPLKSLVESVTRIEIPEWRPSPKRFGIIPGAVFDLLGMRSHEAPRISGEGLRAIAEQLPCRDVSVVFAGRLPSAIILHALMQAGLVRCERRLVDFDDIMSRYRQREIERGMSAPAKVKSLIDVVFLKKAERLIASTWNAVSVCTDDDVRLLQTAIPGSNIVKVPNVISRDLIPARAKTGSFNILFVGNLSFRPNVQGLFKFISDAWPELQRRIPSSRLSVVGMHPIREVRQLGEDPFIDIHANVPSLAPFYQNADVVVAPILYGGGTRIKILEAVAYGRPVVSTTVGAEGLGLLDGRSILLADDMNAFVQQLELLYEQPSLSQQLVQAAKATQERDFSPNALYESVAAMFRGDKQ